MMNQIGGLNRCWPMKSGVDLSVLPAAVIRQDSVGEDGFKAVEAGALIIGRSKGDSKSTAENIMNDHNSSRLDDRANGWL